MLSSSALRSPATPHAAAAKRTAVVRARVRNYDSIPKREPFTTRRSILDQFLKEKPLVERTKEQMTDYCTTLEGDDCCSCWDAYFEINKLEKELPKGELERMVKEAEGDMRYLIDSVHHRAHLRKMVAEKAHSSASSSSQGQTAKPRPFPVPDGLPKTQEELEEEAEALMPESPYTRLLRRMGRYPDWYTPRPDHETD